MRSETPIVAELRLDIASSKANITGAPTREQLIKELHDLEADQELIHEEVEQLLQELNEGR